METSNRSVQTAFRFRPELLDRLKQKARYENKTLNSYVESVLEKTVETEAEQYDKIFAELAQRRPARNVNEFPSIDISLEFSDEELASDPKLEYLVNKHVR